MVPDIEREWIAEECRAASRPAWRLLLVLILLLGIGWALYRWLR
jgi:hypothetical protein